MVAVLAFVNMQTRDVVVVRGDFGGHLGFFARAINNLMSVAHPTALGLICQIGVKMLIFSHILPL